MVRNVLPPGMIYVPESARLDGRPVETQVEGQLQIWAVGHLPMGETVTITFKARVDAEAQDGVHRDQAESGGYCYQPVDGGETVLCGLEDEDRLALGAVNRIRGRVFLDSDEDGRPKPGDKGLAKPGDKGLAGIRVVLDENRATDTDNTGTFWFYKLLPGIYQASLDLTTLPDGVIPTTDTVKTVVLGAGKTFLTYFGLIRYKRIQGIVFDDRNGNGAMDEQESGVAAVQVRIRGTDHAAYTTEDGTFRLERIPEGIRSAVVIDEQQPYLKKEGVVLRVEMR